ncbi:MAG TPA: AI-2E family transporter [Burkholderiales bacterium]|nr:AI-2E family transporter [Burkholderiales bacterium]
MTSTLNRPTHHEIAAWILAGIALLLVLRLHLLSALLSGLLVYELVHVLAPLLQRRLSSERAKPIAVALLSSLVVGVAALAIIGAAAFFHSESGNLPALLKKMAEIIEKARASLPPEIIEALPADADGLKDMLVQWLRGHAAEVQSLGKEASVLFVHILIGMVIGAMIALRETRPSTDYGPLALALTGRAARLGFAFRRIVFAQVRISAINTAFTAIYLAAVLPVAGIHLPFTKTLIAIAFITGLLPVVGNLISNTVIVIVSLSHSPQTAAASLLFLVLIHKAEYFLNARIMGARIAAHSWELLLAMLVMEAAFGLAGVIAAPVYYAYIKDELASRRLV